ncbi:3-hydroxyisobutyryl-CoA hydrolase [Microdochium trichocladiopsis]|uniref:3-hydroxyisobutyryl-CoA hydrolase n=1 Tax=Microdochium trichocladiopsis TaxID=1682393 RepID=A0A9P8Y9C0_9PEZI|nr:3-hydroxyisobutyryl-CoA hydrolase [Microdochium trichocladiopsis]KAH7033363.1 3-hydroxyisobutyryl-CoA hydrolase [Microdochium trichocladiopsis]
MPLKAKILDPSGSQRAQMSTSPDQSSKKRSASDPNDVLFNNLYGLRTIELNRPGKLNSLNGSMAKKILPRLQEWSKSDLANLIVMKGAGNKAFCAGGDVAELAIQNKEGSKGQQASSRYFALEYKLDHYIATYNKPYIAFMDGITMGGGVGLSIHAPFRIATERTVFAMPETTIGFFPDVGASFFLPKMPGAVGTYLALTSDRLTGANVFYSGIATHYLHSTSLPSLESRLAELQFHDYEDIKYRLDIINRTINEFSTGLPHDVPIHIGGELRNAIDRCFGQPTVPKILKALKQETGSTQAWAEQTLATLRQRSPIAVHVTHKQMQVGKTWSIAETFKREHQIAAQFMAHPDFVEGVTCQLISKEKPRPKPQWQPATLEDVKPAQVDAFFNSKLAPELELLSEQDFEGAYPYAWLGLPTEEAVEQYVKSKPRGRKEIIQHFVDLQQGKLGVNVVVDEVLARKTTVGGDGQLVWKDSL